MMACVHDFRMARRAALALSGLLLAACGDGAPVDPTPPAPTWIALVPDSLRFTYLGERVRAQVRVQRVLDLVGGTEVTWSSTDTTIFTVDLEGEVTARANGEAALVAEVMGLRDTARVRVRQEAARIEVVAGGGQRGPAGLELLDPVQVRMTDAGGTLLAVWAFVDFDASAHGGRVSLAVGDPKPYEVWARWTLGPTPGPQSLEVTVVHGPATAEIGAVALHPDSVVAVLAAHSGDGQGALPGEALAEPVMVAVLDTLGRRLPGATVRFEPAAGNGSADPAEAVTDTLGLAATVWTLGEAPGRQTLVASAGAGASVEVGAVALHPDSAVVVVALVHSGDGQEAMVGEALAEPVVVAVLDTLGRRLPGASVRFEPAAGHGSAHPAETLSDTLGLAATVWTLGEAPGRQTLVASAGAGASVEVGAVAQSDEGVCARTPEVAEEIVREVGAASCAEVTDEDLAAITELRLENLGIRRLRNGDFAGLTNLTGLLVLRNPLSELSPGTFEGLVSLHLLFLTRVSLTEWSPDILSGLPSLRTLVLTHNSGLTELPPGAFARVPTLSSLSLYGSAVADLSPESFAGLDNLGRLQLARNRLTELPQGIFAGMASLHHLYLQGNSLDALRSDVFADLERLDLLWLHENRLSELPAGVFDGLSQMRRLRLERNELTVLPPGVFGALTNLHELDLSRNEFRELPHGLFAGLRQLRSLNASGNPGAPFPLRAAFERTDGEVLAPGPARLVVRVAGGAPVALRLPVSVQRATASAGWFEVAAGDTLSAPVMVERSSESSEAVHVSFGRPPALPNAAGFEVVAGAPVVLFAEDDNRTPVLGAALPPHRMQAGGAAVPLALAAYFSDPDGDSLVYGVETSDGRVAVGSVVGGLLQMEPRGEGEAVLQVTASDPGGLAATQELALVVAPVSDPDRFNIEVLFGPGFSERHKDEIRRAARRWEEVVVGDVPDVRIEGFLEACGTGWRMTGVLDDLVINMRMDVGHVTNAMTCRQREASGLNVDGRVAWEVRFSEPGFGRWDILYQVALHEIGHVLGIGLGDAWHRIARSGSSDRADPYYPGPLAIEAFNSAGGLAYAGRKVPLDIEEPWHWRSEMRDDIMAGPFLGHWLSAITVQALADLGYVVDVTKADAYTLPGAGSVAPGGAAADGEDGSAWPDFEFADEIIRGPVMVVDSTGKVVRVIRN